MFVYRLVHLLNCLEADYFNLHMTVCAGLVSPDARFIYILAATRKPLPR